MSNSVTLHVLVPDVFTIPLIPFFNQELKDYSHQFICITKKDDNSVYDLPNVITLSSPHRKHFISNTVKVWKSFRRASKIIMHGNSILYYFFLFPFVLKKTYWVIYGGADMGTKESNKGNSLKTRVKKFVLKRVVGHISHIETDAQLANKIFHSKASFFYSPMYFTNTIDVNNFPVKKGNNSIKKILIGNSTDPSNNHFEIFQMLLPYFKEEEFILYCPLSYGKYDDYKKRVIAEGYNLFGSSFHPILNFMSLEEYRSFLNAMDIAVFNHKRQEAMGVTISLLAMGKTVYLYPKTTSFNSFKFKGIQVYDNALINKGELFHKKDVSSNRNLIEKYYSPEVLKSSWEKIYTSKCVCSISDSQYPVSGSSANFYSE